MTMTKAARGGAAVFLITCGAALFAPRRTAALVAEFDYQLDAYYTAADYYVSLTSSPIPFVPFTSEKDLYKKLFLSSPVPRFLLLEASVNPLPCLGVYLKRQAPAFYEDMQASGDFNLIQSVTTGFEEPAALSLFLGNIVNFKPVRKKQFGEGKGHTGYLISAGNHHIQRNDMFKDDWIETEWKVRGDRILKDLKLGWSFRVGAKFHGHREVRDVYYLGLRRSRTDYAERRLWDWAKNSGFLYKMDFSQKNLAVIQHHFQVDKKFPLKKARLVPTLALGFIWQARDKYTGSLELPRRRRMEFLLRPNIEF